MKTRRTTQKDVVARSGGPIDVYKRQVEELCSDVPKAIDRVNADLPAGFPGETADSISNGMKRRLGILETGEQEEPT